MRNSFSIFIFFLIFSLIGATGAAKAETELESLFNYTHSSTWVYYTDPTGERWYISPVSASKVGVYSLGPITTAAAWWTVSNQAATVDIANNRVIIDGNLDSNSSNIFRDIGSNTDISDPQIHTDRKKIQGTTVPIKWYFFQAPNRVWYIVNAEVNSNPLTVLRFGQKNGQYDWGTIDMKNAHSSFYAVTSNRSLRINFSSLKIDQFLDSNVGAWLDLNNDGSAQCVDLMYAYIKHGLGVENQINLRNNAYAIYKNASNITTEKSSLHGDITFTKIDNNPTNFPQKGDIIFWNSAVGKGYGHVAIVREGDVNRFSSLDQNWLDSNLNTGSPAAVIEHNYNNIAGWLRPQIAQSRTMYITSEF